MIARLVFGLLLFGSAHAFAAEKFGGPPLFDLMKLPNYAAAWKAMIGEDKVPDWVDSFAKTLDGPDLPSMDLLANGRIYVLGFTCKPNECEDNQLYVLFAADGAQAWGMLLEGKRRSWLGQPDQATQETILSRVE
jgi:hypothetical protein